MALINSNPRRLAALIAIVTLGWIVIGYLFPGKRESHEQTAAANPEQAIDKLIMIKDFPVEQHQSYVVVNGATAANREVQLKPEVEGRIEELPVKKGSIVEAGQVIARLDKRDRANRAAEAAALLHQREMEYAASKTLEEKGFRPKLGVAESHTRLEEARGALTRAQLDLRNTEIKAPFHGVLEELNVEVGDFVLSGFFGAGGNALARLVDNDPMLVTAQVGEHEIGRIERDRPSHILLSTGQEHEGTIRYVSNVANPDSRTFKVEVVFANPDHAIPAGVTAELKLPAGTKEAIRVPSSILSLDDKGNVGVKSVAEDGTVSFHIVELLESTPEGVWIGGLPGPKVTLVTVGQPFVSAGQKLDMAQVKREGDAPAPAAEPAAEAPATEAPAETSDVQAN